MCSLSLTVAGVLCLCFARTKAMASRTEQFDAAFQALVTDVVSALAMEGALAGSGGPKITKHRSRKQKNVNSCMTPSMEPRDTMEITAAVVQECIHRRKSEKSEEIRRATDEELFHMATFTDKFRLCPYERFLHYVPRLVNVVTV